MLWFDKLRLSLCNAFSYGLHASPDGPLFDETQSLRCSSPFPAFGMFEVVRCGGNKLISHFEENISVESSLYGHLSLRKSKHG